MISDTDVKGGAARAVTTTTKSSSSYLMPLISRCSPN